MDASAGRTGCRRRSGEDDGGCRGCGGCRRRCRSRRRSSSCARTDRPSTSLSAPASRGSGRIPPCRRGRSGRPFRAVRPCPGGGRASGGLRGCRSRGRPGCCRRGRGSGWRPASSRSGRPGRIMSHMSPDVLPWPAGMPAGVPPPGSGPRRASRPADPPLDLADAGQVLVELAAVALGELAPEVAGVVEDEVEDRLLRSEPLREVRLPLAGRARAEEALEDEARVGLGGHRGGRRPPRHVAVVGAGVAGVARARLADPVAGQLQRGEPGRGGRSSGRRAGRRRRPRGCRCRRSS